MSEMGGGGGVVRGGGGEGRGGERCGKTKGEWEG